MTQRPFRVMKFGGTSVGSPESLGRAVRIIAAERARGPVAVVASAMGDTTDQLIAAIDAAGVLADVLGIAQSVRGR